MLAIAHQICGMSLSLCKNIRNNFSFILLPNHHVLFVDEKRKIFPLDAVMRINYDADIGII